MRTWIAAEDLRVSDRIVSDNGPEYDRAVSKVTRGGYRVLGANVSDAVLVDSDRGDMVFRADERVLVDRVPCVHGDFNVCAGCADGTMTVHDLADVLQTLDPIRRGNLIVGVEDTGGGVETVMVRGTDGDLFLVVGDGSGRFGWESPCQRFAGEIELDPRPVNGAAIAWSIVGVLASRNPHLLGY